MNTHMATKIFLTVSPCPVVQQLQYRSGFRWPKQMADEGDLDNPLHPDDERNSNANCVPIAAPVAIMLTSTNTIVKGGGAKIRPITNADPKL